MVFAKSKFGYDLDFVTPLFSSQRQADAICFVFSSAFDLVSHALLPRKLADDVNWISSYLTSRLSHVPYSGALSSPSEELSLFHEDLH
jgi:hypothetical protein